MGGVIQEAAEIAESSATAEISKKIEVCEECKQNPSKYKCPGCSLRSCSLPCVKAHKQRTGCTGKRKQTQFVPLSQFDDNLLISDYNLLEEMKRVAESAQRMRVKLRAYPYFKLPYSLRYLKNAAGRRRIKLLFLPSGMVKREKNRSYYNQRKKSITWTIEWRFHSTKIVLLDHGIHEDTKLGSIIEKHLKPGPWNHPLKQFCEQLDCLKFFIRKYPKGPRSPFRELDIRAPIGQQLSNLVILEYPIIHVFLPEHSCDFEIIKDVKPLACEPECKNTDLNIDGVHFKEEEIEEDNSSETKVLDMLTEPVKQRPSFQDSQRHESAVAVADIDTSKPMFKAAQGKESVAEGDGLIHSAENNCPFSSSNVDEIFDFNDIDFKFEQELIDAYSDLIAESDPDGFLDLDGAFYKETGLEEGQWKSNVILPNEEELEEGEIPSLES
ncbi:Zinc finger, HIT-type [Dillenia turbinata]|uniref:Box C/D snoRNA protein 1 n=1 Tax=Dillenia turbinata TaxID=194707 RepID=A0AAN8UT24_9MAGN